MDRRKFLASGAATAGAIAASQTGVMQALTTPEVGMTSLDLNRHRFGVNYTPSQNWWYCWNTWDADSIKRDLDAIAALGADHLRIFPISPDFQPNLKWVSPVHLERLDQMISMMGERKLDALVTAFTCGLTGVSLLPTFPPPPSIISQDGFFFNSSQVVAPLVKLAGPHVQDVLAWWWNAEELDVRELARTLKPHNNVIGFDLGAEIDNCWHASAHHSDPWMARMFALMNEVLPAHVHVNGVLNSWLMDDQMLPDGRWFPIAFSPQALRVSCELSYQNPNRR
jgi:hypothetical protein